MADLGILVLRVGFGLMMLIAHGWPKLASGLEAAEKFPDPIGIGSQLSWFLAVGAEVGCSILIIIGLLTRFASVPLIVTMLVAAFVVHGDDPFQKKELALTYLIGFLAIFKLGAGGLSLDALFISRGENE